jgi:hypothetical protein
VILISLNFTLYFNKNGWICYRLEGGKLERSVTSCRNDTIMWRHMMPRKLRFSKQTCRRKRHRRKELRRKYKKGFPGSLIYLARLTFLPG